MKIRVRDRALAMMTLLSCAVAAQPSLSAPVRVHIDAQPLDAALNAWAEQTGFSVLIPYERAARGKSAPEVVGTYTPEGALRVLLATSDLRYEFVGANAVAIRTANAAPREAAAGEVAAPPIASTGSDLRVSDARQPVEASTTDSPSLTSRSESTEGGSTQKVDTVVVTGTHLRDTEPVAPVLTFTRQDFDKSGASTAEAFLSLLPQNFGGAESSDTTESSLPGLKYDFGFGSAVSLRGVGGSATLVLVDGRRLAPAGFAAYTDVSMIPLSAVERIEVMPDGASALYGSDAIGGVVNFVLRKDFSGAETQVRYGDTTRGGLAERQVSQVLGSQWSTGNALLSYEFSNQSELDRYDRSFSSDPTFSPTNEEAQNGPRALIPSQQKHGVSAFAKQMLSDRFTLFANGMYSRRNSDEQFWDPVNAVLFDEDVQRNQYGGGLGLTVELGQSWQGRIDGSLDRDTMRRTDLSPVERFDYDSLYDLRSMEAQLNGDLLQLPWGALKLATGIGYREESFNFHDYTDQVARRSLLTDTMSTKSAFVEASVPIGRRGDLPRAPLMLSLAGRYEDHSTFGDTIDPKIGLRWTPLRALSFYASYGTSFRAPSVYEFQTGRQFSSVILLNVPTANGPVRSLLRTGSSDDLKEETARTFTGGIEFTVPVGSGLGLKLNYFSIDYNDRITSVTATNANLLTQSAYQSLVTVRGSVPDADFEALVAQYLSGTRAQVVTCPGGTISPSTGACSTPPSSVGAIIDRRLQNFAEVEVSGLDLSVDQALEWGANRLNFDLNASYFLDFSQQLDPASDNIGILNSLYNPVNLRLRGGTSFSRGAWGAALFVNHTDGYSTRGSLFRSDGTPMPLTDISSWTTLDMSLTYRSENTGSWLSGFVASLSVLNLFDRDPPHVDDQYIGLGYDPANADPRGRSVGVLVRKSW